MTTSSLFSSRQMLVGDLLRRGSHQNPNKTAFTYNEISLTYGELEERALQLAGWLQQQLNNREEKVGFIFKNCLTFVEVFFGVSLSGAVGVPINFRLTANEIVYILNNSDTKILFIEQEYLETIRSIREQLPKLEKVIVYGTDNLGEEIAYNTLFEEPLVFHSEQYLIDDGPCMIVYTSGTTGKPKGAVLTHKNLWVNAMSMAYEFRVDGSFKQILVNPMFHVAGISCILISTFSSGTTIIHREFNSIKILETIHADKVNSIFLAPVMWNFIINTPNIENYDLTSMRRCMSGAAICPLVIKEKIMHHFPNAGIYDIFGQTEMSPSTTCLHPEDSLRKTTSVGKAIQTVEVRVVDDQMQEVPIGEVGEIIYRGPGLMKEYYKNPEATQEAFAGGWFHSGDIVRMDDEGFIYVVDRKKDMIISGGENIYPAEVEEVLVSHPSIMEAAVVGVPDPEWGESVKAFVVLKAGQSLTADEVIQHCKAHLASYKKPKQVEFLEQLPRNTSGKILKRALKTVASI